MAIFCGLAQQERELASHRTRVALAELKAKGVKLGRPNASFSDEDRAKAVESNRSKTLNNPNNVKAAAMIRLLLIQTKSLTIIAQRLNEGGFQTANGREFRPSTVSRLIRYYDLR